MNYPAVPPYDKGSMQIFFYCCEESENHLLNSLACGGIPAALILRCLPAEGDAWLSLPLHCTQKYRRRSGDLATTNSEALCTLVPTVS